LKKKILEMEAEQAAMTEQYTSGMERMHDEYSQKISLLQEIVNEKGLIIEIMKKDLEIKMEENDEVRSPTQSFVFSCVVRIWINANYLVWARGLCAVFHKRTCANKFYPGLDRLGNSSYLDAEHAGKTGT
jgi:hypothetical protein